MNSSRKPYILGLDIGIGSVGWGIIDENRTIIDAGVRLFPEADKTNNESRRSFIGTRRLLRRRKHRIERIKDLLDSFDIWSKSELPTQALATKPYHIRAKGLSERLSLEELTIALLHLGKRRGIHNVDVAEDDTSSNNELSTIEQITKNKKLLQDQFVCQLQLQRLETHGAIRGHENRFKTSDYVTEANKLLTTQKSFHSQITDEFINKYIELLETRREYFEGPGKGSPFGWDQDIHKWYENMIGKCSYFPDELRAVKESYSAQLFNLLNDLNNLTISRDEDEKLSKQEKIDIVNQLFKKYQKVTMKRIANLLNVTEHDIKGFRIDKKGNPLFTTLSIYHDIKKITKKPEVLDSIELLDQIAEIVTIYQTKTDKCKELVKLNLPVDEESIDQISEMSYSSTHALSLKMINLLLEDLWETPKNQMELISQKGYKPKKVTYENNKYIPFDQIDDLILSPVVKRSFKQTIRVVNAIIKQYGTPTEIVVELAREKNSKDKKKFIQNIQKKHRVLNEQVKEKLETMDIDASKGLFQMLRLWHLQDGLCMYSVSPIKLEELVYKPYNYEIDHVIPRSVSFDDSQNNKVLVKKEENQKKGNLTPFQYFKSSKATVSYEKFKANVLQMAKSKEKMPRKKKEYLLEERDINKYSVQKEFINRNLVDTRYTTREILTTLKQFFEAHHLPVKVKSINGSFTNYLRKLWDFNKDRGADFKHHAEDALIVAMANHIFENKKEFQTQNLLYSDDHVVDSETGEILSEGQFDAALTEKMNKVKAIKQYAKYKYSHKVDIKPNRQLMNDTLYSTRKIDNEEYVVNKITNLYDKDQDKLKKIMSKTPDQLLMYHHDKQTFSNLQSIMQQYSEATNPLYQYYQETGEYLKKYSKKGNGPIVKSIKYYGNKLKEHHDVSNKYKPKNKKVVNLSLKPFRMDVFYEDNKYKFITIRFNDLKEEKGAYVIDQHAYCEKMKKKGITSIDSFRFSLYKNDVIKINDGNYRLIGVNSDTGNIIELNKVNYDYKDYCQRNNIKNNRIKISIGKTITTFEKINFDVLGNAYYNQFEKIKWEFNK
ncbi:type II CRISPR RNA-guided endonuclease Cas9 [Paraliobacillus sp. JSM ZJ581]|uniref:type II CRISPR RNA-guided endonuclease Cas9 n=1 Tax=Paraliobacillus sp. JSM ZJ581 TaxID=3342118 RepID=UPI0035A8884E